MRVDVDHATGLQNLMVSRACGGQESAAEYTRLRTAVMGLSVPPDLIPELVRTSRTLDQFWHFISHKFPTYAERRTFLWDAFGPLLDGLEAGATSPSDGLITTALQGIDAGHVRDAWSKALERRKTDPEGAITMARTLVETVCKHILDAAGEDYTDAADITRLYGQASRVLAIAPSQHSEQVFKQILGGCASTVEGLGALRNRLSDAHGKGRAAVRPAPRHAELAVNLAGALATFLMATWDARSESPRA